MSSQQRRQRDLTGWFLGGVIVALAVLDLYVWAMVLNVPNPVSELLGTKAAHASSVHHIASKSSPFH